MGMLVELWGLKWTSDPQGGPKGAQWNPHLQFCQDFWAPFGFHFGDQDGFSASSCDCFQGSVQKAFWTSSGHMLNCRRCSGACKNAGELDVAHFGIDAVTGAPKVSFRLRWGAFWRSFGPSEAPIPGFQKKVPRPTIDTGPRGYRLPLRPQGQEPHLNLL